MANLKLCDVHDTENHVIRQENTMRIDITRYDTNLRKYLHLFLDACSADITSRLIERAKANGVDVENGWLIDVLIPPNTPKYNKGKKWKHAWMKPEEYEEYQKDIESAETEEPEQEEPQTPRVQTGKKR